MDFYFQHLLQMSQSADPGQRMQALDVLGKEYIDQVDGPLLLSLLHKAPTYQEQTVILGTMSQLGARTPREALLDILANRETPDWMLRHAVAGTLAALGKDAPVDVFIALLQNPTEDLGLRESIASFLGDFGERVPLDILITAVADPEPAICAAAIESLSAQGPRAPLEPILAHVNHPEWDVRKAAIRALSFARERAPIEPIVAALSDPDEHVRDAAALGIDLLLEWFGNRVPLAPLITALGDDNAQVRESALDTLANHPQYAPLDLVVKALDDQNPYVRCAALLVLEHMGRNRVPEEVDHKLLAMTATEPHSNARKYAIKTLFVLKGIPPGKAHDYPGELFTVDDLQAFSDEVIPDNDDPDS